MAAKDYPYFNLGNLNLKINPLLLKDGDMIRSVNVVNNPVGAKKKRPGYATFLNQADSSPVNNLFYWGKDDGTTAFLYRTSGSVVYYYNVGVGTQTTWTPVANGTFSANARIGHAVLENTLIVGDGVGSTRHTTSGTSFTNTTDAPLAGRFQEYQNRVYAIGTASTMFYSTTGDPTNWSGAGTADSSSIQIPGAGKLNGLFKISDRLISTKNSGAVFRWDGFELVDNATELAPSSPDSFDKVEDLGFYMNRLGVFATNGGKPQLLSNAVERLIYNDANTGIAGTQFDTIAGVAHYYDYLASIGTVSEDLTNGTISNCILKYDYQNNGWDTWSFAHKPNAFVSYKDKNGELKLVFGDTNGNTYTYGGTATADGTLPITTEMVFVIHLGKPDLHKKFNWFTGVFNPGCEAQIQYAVSNTFAYSNLNWQTMPDALSGIVDYRFRQGDEGRLLFVKITESSKTTPLSFYGFSINAEIQPRRN